MFVRSVFILLRKERNNVFLCVVVCFFSRVSVFFEDTCAKTKKRAKNWREKKIHSQTSSNDIIDQFSKDQIQRAVDKELL